MELLLFASVLFLAYANGANDNFKGVATLFGSGVSDYRKAILWATITTFLGSLAAIFLATSLLATFSGHGLVPDKVVTLPTFTTAVALGAAITVMLAARLGFPISTTHALVGALVGSGYFASDSGVDLAELWDTMFKPLLASPLLALVCALVLYASFRQGRRWLGVERNTCVCIGEQVVECYPEGVSSDAAVARFEAADRLPEVKVGIKPECEQRYSGRVLGIELNQVIDGLHYLSGGAVSFARGLNDTPKIAAVLLAASSLGTGLSTALVAVLIAVGGYFSARQVAETMSHRVTQMNAGQGLTANLVTSGLDRGLAFRRVGIYYASVLRSVVRHRRRNAQRQMDYHHGHRASLDHLASGRRSFRRERVSVAALFDGMTPLIIPARTEPAGLFKLLVSWTAT